MKKIKIYKTTYENGDKSLDIDFSHCPYSKVVKEEEQEIEIDETKWKIIE